MSESRARLLAVLGPTNTGKTHFAIERMLGHATGMIGFPLRLLARENYDRIVRAKGAATVALITGEEKIIPPRPRWYVCTTESMPLDRPVSFLAVDEIQLCADPDRGHIFTDRLLHARGQTETVFLGAETIKPLLRRLVPGIEITTRPRLSTLAYDGPRKLNRLPARSAVVAFSAADVYALAEFVRRQKGGAAVVLGALSPRTRNAQVGLYQAGEVDYIVATDAIGMGLNMDVDHVAFAALRKFDGRFPRGLDAAEIAQIAGRAGRHMNDGTFGTTGDVGAIDPETVAAVEAHAFPPLKSLYWRNEDLRFPSVPVLLAGLERAPEGAGLVRVRDADDHVALATLAHDPEILALANHPERVRLLWEVCRIPDFRKVMAENHTRLLGQIFRHLCGPGRRLPTDWLAGQVKRLDRTDGDIDTLVQRIASVRTWTYVSHRADWVREPGQWQDATRALEDRLSDALHERLTQRFVDRRTAQLVRKMRDQGEMGGAVAASGEVVVEGHVIGRLDGFRFQAAQSESAMGARTVLSAAGRALRGEIVRRLDQLCADDAADFALNAAGTLDWRGQALARLLPGADGLRPQLDLLASDLLEPAERDRLRRHLSERLAVLVAAVMQPLLRVRDAPVTGAARGLAHQLAQGLGTLRRAEAAAQMRALDQDGRQALTRLGVRFGTESIYMPALLKPACQHCRAILWAVSQTAAAPLPLPLPVPGARGAVAVDPSLPSAAYLAMGYVVLDGWAMRADLVERFAAELRRLERAEQPPASPLLLSLTGLGAEATARIAAALRPDPAAPRRTRPSGRIRKAASDSPFAVLKTRLGRP